ncbi:Por secretion system C-terminal sorting domain-containing protein [Mesonia phycicola]|uniref:Por secretion system C-terminal sorting domain-containing protein n=1 Tax=Mesonia phycicola TaxID=579105 RepID=A0A1M6C0T4_9FLAO|nr:T9SS type A sorting domain-containing protein [Mesonia phycicola]SHI54590.1 Por secretion system C-terminal sorting domain-containing protein [Mesonia phycicola]
MKKIITLLLFVLSICSFAQENSSKILNNINQYKQYGYEFKNYSLFKKNTPNEETLIQNISKSVNNATFLEIDTNVIQQIYKEKPLLVSISIPYQNSVIEIELYKKDILSEDFQATDQNKETINYKPGAYYRGVIKNSEKSIVAFSFFKNSAYGVASSLRLGNVNIGKIKDSETYIAYTESDLKGENPFTCGFSQIEENTKKITEKLNNTSNSSAALTNNCVRIYYEVAYQPYVENNYDSTQTLNWLTSIHNNISTLYANDNIQIALSTTMIWTTPDPYTYGYQNNLYYFYANRTTFNGDLAHLINQPSTTSVAFLDSLCEENNYAYSAVSQYFNQIPAYSWTINASTHEIGHSFGSPHTHACYWNGNNTAIDGCGPAGGANEGCNAIIPSNGGTIMSYCHLVSVGTNLANGFHSQPAQLMRDNINNKTCLGTDCINSCFRSIDNVVFNNTTSTSTDITINDNYSNQWYYNLKPYGNNSNNWITTNTNTFSVNNLSPNTYYQLSITNICNNTEIGSALNFLFLTDGDFCGNDQFFDSGLQFNNYGNNQNLIKTFYPTNSNNKVTLSFSEFNTELDYDFMTIYDGTSVNDPVFTNGDNLSGNLTSQSLSYTATNTDGAITIKFTSDSYTTRSGWTVNISCGTLSTTNIHKTSINIYPNPTNAIFHVDAETNISSITIYDIAGRKVIENNNLSTNNAQINIETLMSGAYFVNVEVNGKREIFKIVKN